jgi:hypothetical protein
LMPMPASSVIQRSNVAGDGKTSVGLRSRIGCRIRLQTPGRRRQGSSRHLQSPRRLHCKVSFVDHSSSASVGGLVIVVSSWFGAFRPRPRKRIASRTRVKSAVGAGCRPAVRCISSLWF